MQEEDLSGGRVEGGPGDRLAAAPPRKLNTAGLFQAEQETVKLYRPAVQPKKMRVGIVEK